VTRGLDADCSYQNVWKCVRRFLVRVQRWMVVGRSLIVKPDMGGQDSVVLVSS